MDSIYADGYQDFPLYQLRSFVLGMDHEHKREVAALQNQLKVYETDAFKTSLVDMMDIMKSLAQKNGSNQDVFVLEEMAELQKELTKHRRGKDNRDEIVEESVDVLLTIFILLQVYGATMEDVTKIMHHKLSRLRDPLKTNND